MDRHYLKTLLISLPDLVLNRRQRALLAEMRHFDSALAGKLHGSLPEAMASLTPSTKSDHSTQAQRRRIRRIGDIAIQLNGESELGLCLRRSLLRYHYLRQLGLQVTINFGARIIDGQPDRSVTGHAWLTLNHVPYHESGENWRGFTVMYAFPEKQT